MNHLLGSTIHVGKYAGRLLRRYWSGLVSLALTFLLVSHVTTGLAAPLHQTVPPPTPTPDSQPVPTATPVPDNNDDDDDDDNNQPPPPTNTPVPQPTVAPGLTGSVSVPRLNVRQGPGTNYPVIGTVSQGETVTILSRNEFGDWWRACCITGTNQDGWMAAQFILPNFDLGQANVLIAIDGAIPTPPPPPTPTPTVDPSTIPTTTVPSSATLLELQVQQDPPYAWQGGTITLIYQLNNAGPATATNVEVRNELPAELGFLSADPVSAGAFLTETVPVSRTVVVFRWPELQAGAAVSASVQVSVSSQLINGTVFENLAVAGADNVQPVTAGISIGMPPVSLPDFR